MKHLSERDDLMNGNEKITSKAVNIFSIICLLSYNIVACILGIVGLVKQKVISPIINIISGFVFGIFFIVGIFSATGAHIYFIIAAILNVVLIIISAKYRKEVAPKKFTYETNGQPENKEPFRYL